MERDNKPADGNHHSNRPSRYDVSHLIIKTTKPALTQSGETYSVSEGGFLSLRR